MTGLRSLAIARRVVVIAAILAVTAAISPASAGRVAAAADGLRLSSATTYSLVPEAHVVRAVVDVTAINEQPDRVNGGVITRFFYDSFRIGVQAEARSIRATSGGSSLGVSTQSGDGYLRVEVRLAHSIFFHQTAKVRVTFTLPGGAPRSRSEIRVGPAFATFIAWAFGDAGSVRIVVPGAFDTATTGNDLSRATVGGSTVLTANVSDVSSWYAVVNADRPSKLTDTDVHLAGGEELRIRAWPDDPAWKRQVTDLLTRGLPALTQLTGLAWPMTGAVSVTEVHTPLLEGYAGVFYEGRNRIEVSEDLDDLTIVHEASHAWFNSGLFEGRWLNEGFADTYAAMALHEIGLGRWRPEAVAPDEKASVKLNDWQKPGRISDATTDARERFGYNASWTLVSSLVSEVGVARMQAVLTRANEREIAYAGAGSPEQIDGATDWRRLLDLLDEIAGSHQADALFRTWVVGAPDLAVMDRRDAARLAYAGLNRHGNDWLAPMFVRQPMSDWNFPLAATRIAAADGVLDERDRIATEATSLGVTVPTNLRTAYQTATTSLDGATTAARTELAELDALQQATAAEGRPRDPLVALGLLGTDPTAELAAAKAAFSAGADDALARATQVDQLIAGAGESGRQRLLVVIVGGDLVFGLVVIAIVARRRRHARGLGMAHPGPYATLAAPSSVVDAGEERPIKAPAAPRLEAHPRGAIQMSATDPFDATDRFTTMDPFDATDRIATEPNLGTKPTVATQPPPTGDAS